MKYDLAVIGGGPGGYNAAERAAHGGMKVILFEERALGGVCLNEGCIPTKTLLNSAKLYLGALHSEAFGVTVSGASIDHAKVVDRKDKVVRTLVSGVAAKMKGAGVTVVSARASIAGKSADGYSVTALGETYTAEKLLICTGSEAVIPPVAGLREAYENGLCVTNREVLELREVPKKLVVIGGGVIGLETAAYFAAVGSDVTVVEMLPKIAGPTDADISRILQRNLEKAGIKFLLSAKVTSVSGKKNGGSVTVDVGGKSETLAADTVLVSTGRRARTEGLGLENVGIHTERGAVVTDESCRTNVPGIWAAGDVNVMIGKPDRVDYRSIPSVIYTKPEVASVGESVESAAKQGIKASEHTVTLKYSGRYIAETEGGDGIVKIVIDDAHRTILGVHMIGSYASEIIYGAAGYVAERKRVEDVRKIVFPHPTVCEVIREGMFMI